MEVTFEERKCAYITGKDRKFDLRKEEDFMEITQWTNGDGFTISISNNLGSRTFELSWEELEGIKYLISRLENE